MNDLEKLKDYLSGEHGIDVEPELDDIGEECYYDRQLKELILAYGASERKEGYKKGFEDGEAESDDYIPLVVSLNG